MQSLVQTTSVRTMIIQIVEFYIIYYPIFISIFFQRSPGMQGTVVRQNILSFLLGAHVLVTVHDNDDYYYY